jgi:hypothetical protein
MAGIKITDLPSAQSLSSSDFLIIDDSVDTMKTTLEKVKEYSVGDIQDLDTTAKASIVEAINEVKGETTSLNTAAVKLETLIVSISSVSSLPVTANNSDIESDMVVINSELSDPSAQISDWTVTTASGSLTVSGSISGTTNIKLYLTKSR